MTEYNDLKTYFSRLAPSAPEEINSEPAGDRLIKELYDRRYIICHYDDIASFSEEDYDDSAADLEDVVNGELVEEGGICLVQLDADNDFYKQDGVRKIGVVPPGQEPVIIGAKADESEDGYSLEIYDDVEEADEELDEEEHNIYKGVKMREKDSRDLSEIEYFLSRYEPPNTTFSSWYVVEEQLKALMKQEDLPSGEPTSYSPDHTEVLCEEYLREEYGFYPLMQPGGSSGISEDFDIKGGIDDSIVFGEVKNTKNASEDALEDLQREYENHSESVMAFYFSRNEVDEEVEFEPGVILLDEVIETLRDTERTRRMMDEMTSYS
jgi:hypothetical protein